MPAHLTELGTAPDAPFPKTERALRDPDGLLAWGGDLHPQRLLNAYAHGCFPWYSEGQPILWWSPDPRMVLATDGVHVAHRFARFLRHSGWSVRADQRFAEVIHTCATMPRRGQDGTWIVPEMIAAYQHLHSLGFAHSIEVSDAAGRLVGGVYGIGIGRMFFGESMFSATSNGSKVALLGLCGFLASQGMPILDCQMDTPHLRSLGGHLIDRADFLHHSRALCAQPSPTGAWRDRFGEVSAADLARLG